MLPMVITTYNFNQRQFQFAIRFKISKTSFLKSLKLQIVNDCFIIFMNIGYNHN